MATNVRLQSVQESGWLMGFNNLLRKEFGEWWGTRSWLIHLVIWTLLVSAVVLAVVNAPMSEEMPEGAPPLNPIDVGIMLFTTMAGISTTIGIIIVMQDAIIGEKQSGTAAWLLSKPVSRPAIILSKVIANSVSAVILMIVSQAVLSYLILTAAGATFTLSGWLVGTALLALHLLFYLALTLMLGAFFNGRGPVIGIPMGLLFGYQILVGFVPGLAQFMPWVIIFPPPGQSQNLGAAAEALSTMAIRGLPLPTTLPIVITAVWCIVFVVVAIWRFGKEEF